MQAQKFVGTDQCVVLPLKDYMQNEFEVQETLNFMQLKPMYGEETGGIYRSPPMFKRESIPVSPLKLWDTDDTDSYFKNVDEENGRFLNC